MKYYIFSFIFILQASLSLAQDNNRHYLGKFIPNEPVKNVEDLPSFSKERCHKIIQYMDDFGRPEQVIFKNGSPNGHDIIQPIEYDDFGRMTKKYLPYTHASNSSGLYVSTAIEEQKNYYSNSIGGISKSDYAYSKTTIEPSPLNRTLETGAPGADWQPQDQSIANSGHTVKIEYGANVQNDVMILKVNADNELLKTGFYPEKTLFRTVIKDENWTESSGIMHTSEEYKNKQGQLLLKRNFVEDGDDDDSKPDKIETYYVYDDYGLLRYMIPPEAVKQMYGSKIGSASNITLIDRDETLNSKLEGDHAFLLSKGSRLNLEEGFIYAATEGNSLTISNGNVSSELIYCYKYDSRKRMIEKKIPGAEPIYMVYDERDRLVLTQNGLQRAQKYWSFTQYDALNRPVITGEVNSSKTHEELQALFKDFYGRDGNLYESRTIATPYYTKDNSFPIGVNSYRFASYTYYDNYTPFFSESVQNQFNTEMNDFAAHNFENVDTPSATCTDKVKGLITGTKVRVDFNGGDDGWVETINYYDDQYSPLLFVKQYQIEIDGDMLDQDNPFEVTAQEKVFNAYDFVGKVTESWSLNSLSFGGAPTTITRQVFKYDHIGRLLTIQQQLTHEPQLITIAENSYNELGELVNKKVGQDTQGNPIQQMDYCYNIRGWLTQINNPDISTLPSDKQFSLKLHYNNPLDGLNSAAQYNGNISALEWRTPQDNSIGSPNNKQAYAYGYDALNRIKTADYGEGTSFDIKSGYFDVDITGYDLNGNIKGLQRKKDNTLIDNLAYSYIGNQLSRMLDSSNNTDGFKQNTNTANTYYSYDANGNMTSDQNKGIAVSYDRNTNLPIRISGNKPIRYRYDASGTKLYKIYDWGNDMTGYLQFYIGNCVYKRAVVNEVFQPTTLEYMIHPEGRYIKGEGTGEYEYDIKDHLGNTRLVVSANKQIKQQSAYYPFGMSFMFGGSSDNKYLYNGKEIQDDDLGGGASLGWYDYGFRMYDATIGKWHVPEPFADSYATLSPYAYAYNNPIAYVDLFGLAPVYRDGKYYDDVTGDEMTWDEVHQHLVEYDMIEWSFTSNGDGTYTFNNYGGGVTAAGAMKYLNDSGISAFGSFVGVSRGGNVFQKDADPATVNKFFSHAEFRVDKSGGGMVSSGGLALEPYDGPLYHGGMPLVGVGPGNGAVALRLITSGALALKMTQEIERIRKKVNNTRGFVYELRVNNSGTYRDVRGNLVQMNAGDVWKYGETTKGFGRYQQSELDGMVPGGVTMFPIFHGNVIEIKIQEKIMIYGYSMMNLHLPPGNRIYR